MSHKTMKNYVSTYKTNAICIFTAVKPAEFKSDALFLKHPVDCRENEIFTFEKFLRGGKLV